MKPEASAGRTRASGRPAIPAEGASYRGSVLRSTRPGKHDPALPRHPLRQGSDSERLRQTRAGDPARCSRQALRRTRDRDDRFVQARDAARPYAARMDVEFIASIAVISPDPRKSRDLFIDALGLPLGAGPGSDYFHSERIEGSKHFGLWPLSQAAQACFGTPDWPADRTVPQMSLEFEVRDADAVGSAAEELRRRGFTLLQTVARSRGVRRWLGFNRRKARSSGSRSSPPCMTDPLANHRRGLDSHGRWPLVDAAALRFGG